MTSSRFALCTLFSGHNWVSILWSRNLDGFCASTLAWEKCTSQSSVEDPELLTKFVGWLVWLQWHYKENQETSSRSRFGITSFHVQKCFELNPLEDGEMTHQGLHNWHPSICASKPTKVIQRWFCLSFPPKIWDDWSMTPSEPVIHYSYVIS